MAERIAGSAVFEDRGFVERRLEGQTFTDALVAYRSFLQGVDISQIPQGDNRNRFESVRIERLSGNYQHALAFGEDMGRTTLLRDGEPVLTVEGVRGLRVRAASADFSRVIAINDVEREDVYLIFPDETKQIMPGYHVNVLGCSEDLDRVLYSHYTPGDRKTTFRVFQYSEGGRTETVFDVKGDFSEPKLIGASPAFLRIVWQGKATTFLGGQTGDTFVFDNNQFLGKGDRAYAFANKDVSRTLVVLKNGRMPWTLGVRVLVNGEEVFKKKGLRVREVKVTPDLSAAAIDVGYDYVNKNGQLLIVRLGQKPQLSEEYDRLESLQGVDDGLRAIVVRDKVQYEITVPAE